MRGNCVISVNALYTAEHQRIFEAGLEFEINLEFAMHANRLPLASVKTECSHKQGTMKFTMCEPSLKLNLNFLCLSRSHSSVSQWQLLESESRDDPLFPIGLAFSRT